MSLVIAVLSGQGGRVTEEVPRWHLTVGAGVLEAVGRVTVQFAHLEEELEALIWSLVAGFDVLGSAPASVNSESGSSLQAQSIGKAITARLMFRPKVDIACALLAERLPASPETTELLSRLKQALEDVSEERNRIVHLAWSGAGGGRLSPAPGSATGFRMRPGEGGRVQETIVVRTQEDLASMADVIAALGWQVSEVRRKAFSPQEGALGATAG